AALTDIYSVRFASATQAWLFAHGKQILRTTGAADATNVGTAWQDAQWDGANCRINATITDAFFLPSNPSVAYFTSESFGQMFFTANSLSSAAQQKSGGANGFDKPHRLAMDPENSNRGWEVSNYGDGTSFFVRSDDGWTSTT